MPAKLSESINSTEVVTERNKVLNQDLDYSLIVPVPGVQPDPEVTGYSSTTWDRCYDFLNIFAFFAKKMAFLTQNKGK
jgi:hypothetical protein